uniref:Uncharacterized protein n=1 Tax=Avena sativa TaxID=4498 RepID=A0ACD5ULB0_AVESA
MAVPMPPMPPMAMPMPPPPVLNMPPMGPMGPTPPSDMPGMFMPMPEMHAAFFWGHRAQVLFRNWPGYHGDVGMYILCLVVVFVLAALVEALSAASKRISSRRPAAVLAITGIHAVKMGLAYVVMLAVMSFNVGVLLAAVAGHTIGYLLARIGLFRRATSSGEDDAPRNGALAASESEAEPRP